MLWLQAWQKRMRCVGFRVKLILESAFVRYFVGSDGLWMV